MSSSQAVSRHFRLAGISGAVAACLVLGAAALCTSPFAHAEPSVTNLQVPTTKILAIGSWTEKATTQAWRPLVPQEMRQTANLYLAGKIDQWYAKPDQSGVVFIMNVTSVAEAHGLLEKLPLGVAGLMQFQLIPLGPLSPLRTLLGPTPR